MIHGVSYQTYQIYKAKIKNEHQVEKKTQFFSYYIISLLSSKLSDSRPWSQDNVILTNKITSNITFNTIIPLIHFVIKFREIDLVKLRKIINQWKYYFLQPLLFRTYHSLALFNLRLTVKNCACQYFSLSHKTIVLSSFCTETFSINCTSKYSKLLLTH